MNIAGRYIEDGEAARRLNEVKTAMVRVPFDAPLRPLLEFLLGYIDAQGDEIEEKKEDVELLELAKESNLEERLGTAKGLEALVELKL